jgi:hypothetical protein
MVSLEWGIYLDALSRIFAEMWTTFESLIEPEKGLKNREMVSIENCPTDSYITGENNLKESSDTDSNNERAGTKDKTETIPQYRTENTVTEEHVFMVKHGQNMK